jgi:pyruvate,orthophosphate dikinase
MTVTLYAFGNGESNGDPKQRDVLGGKGAGLVEMTKLGLPVPPGFILPTTLCIPYLKAGRFPEGVAEAIDRELAVVGERVGMRFGDTEKPLLVSVRSGARASMPGMMDTILNLGLSERTIGAVVKMTGNARFAWDAYRRFVTMYADVAMGLDREPFDHALDAARGRLAKERGIDVSRLNAEELKRKLPDSELSEEALRELTFELKELVRIQAGRPFPEDPKEQLLGAVEAVFRSWNNHRAQVYRKMHDIPWEWGTACIVQAMVFGNLGDDSATGVAFTRNPSTGERALFGEWLPNAQGEDVVAGIRTPHPVRNTGSRDDAESLETKMPEVFRELAATAEKLEQHFRDMQDLEFTVQRGKFYMLQCRTGKRTGKAAVRIATEMVREGLISREEAVLRVDPSAIDQLLHPALDPHAPKKLLARGLPASPGAASGKLVFTADEAEALGDKGVPVILARVETSPEDIHGMKAARGVVTARGGMTSHAAVVARGMGKPCVAGCSAVHIDARAGTAVFALEGGEKVTLKRGDVVTLDGGTGSIYEGAVPTTPASVSGDFGELMQWADAARRLGVRANADTALDARTARAFGAEGIGLCRTEHMFFDEERIGAVREMILASTKEDREAALAKLLPFQRGDFEAIFKEMDGLPVTIRLLDPPLHEFLPQEPEQVRKVAEAMKLTTQQVEQRAKELAEFNPMLGHRGCRLAITFPEIYAMQVRAILEAAVRVTKTGTKVFPEIMIPLAITAAELEKTREITTQVAEQVFSAEGTRIDYHFGTMIELPRAALRAGDLAKVAEFFSFGTNDLTQATLGLSRDDAGKFLPTYVDQAILPKDPFVSIDQAGVGELVKLACERGRAERPGMKLGVCGEHGGDPASVAFFHGAGLDYVSCSPFRVPVARLAAAQAALREKS